MTKPWREFEKLVTRIEKNLSPLGAIVTSPDKIPDKITGQIREVDASVRYKIGSADILITIECRDRNTTQDITWLEQIKSKKDSIGAHQTIVVSREGFTEPAKRYAQQHGLALRQLSEVTDQFILNCVNSLKIVSQQLGYQISAFNIGFWRKDGDEKFKSLKLTSETDALIDKMLPFAKTEQGEEITLKDLFEECLSMSSRDIWAQLESRKEIFAELDAHFEPNNVSTQTVDGERHIQVILFRAKFFVEEKQLPVLKPFQYTDENGKVIDSFSRSKDLETGLTVDIKFDWDEKLKSSS